LVYGIIGRSTSLADQANASRPTLLPYGSDNGIHLRPVGGYLLSATLHLGNLLRNYQCYEIERFALSSTSRRAPKLAPLITAVGMSFILQFVAGCAGMALGRKNWPSLLPNGHLSILGVKLPLRPFISFAVTIRFLLALHLHRHRPSKEQSNARNGARSDASLLKTGH
jgi:hypothetical protein